MGGQDPERMDGRNQARKTLEIGPQPHDYQNSRVSSNEKKEGAKKTGKQKTDRRKQKKGTKISSRARMKHRWMQLRPVQGAKKTTEVREQTYQDQHANQIQINNTREGMKREREEKMARGGREREEGRRR